MLNLLSKSSNLGLVLGIPEMFLILKMRVLPTKNLGVVVEVESTYHIIPPLNVQFSDILVYSKS